MSSFRSLYKVSRGWGRSWQPRTDPPSPNYRPIPVWRVWSAGPFVRGWRRRPGPLNWPGHWWGEPPAGQPSTSNIRQRRRGRQIPVGGGIGRDELRDGRRLDSNCSLALKASQLGPLLYFLIKMLLKIELPVWNWISKWTNQKRAIVSGVNGEVTKEFQE